MAQVSVPLSCFNLCVAKDVLHLIKRPSGFKSVASMSRGYPYFDLWAVGSKEELSEEQMQALAREHMTPV